MLRLFVAVAVAVTVMAGQAMASYDCQNSKYHVKVQPGPADGLVAYVEGRDGWDKDTFDLESVATSSDGESVYRFENGKDYAELYVKASGAAYLRLAKHFETPVLLACVSM